MTNRQMKSEIRNPKSEIRNAGAGHPISLLAVRFGLDIRQPAFVIALSLALSLSAAGSSSEARTNAAAVQEKPPVTSKDFFNAGTRRLREGKLREAEASLQAALAKQDERVQPELAQPAQRHQPQRTVVDWRHHSHDALTGPYEPRLSGACRAVSGRCEGPGQARELYHG